MLHVIRYNITSGSGHSVEEALVRLVDLIQAIHGRLKFVDFAILDRTDGVVECLLLTIPLSLLLLERPIRLLLEVLHQHLRLLGLMVLLFMQAASGNYFLTALELV